MQAMTVSHKIGIKCTNTFSLSDALFQFPIIRSLIKRIVGLWTFRMYI